MMLNPSVLIRYVFSYTLQNVIKFNFVYQLWLYNVLVSLLILCALQMLV